MKIVAWLLVALFMLFAGFQLNDPDPVLWTLVYISAALMWLACALGRFYRIPVSILAGLVSIWMVTLFPGLLGLFDDGDLSKLFGSLRMDQPYIEESREFLGLSFVLISAAVLLLLERRNRKKTP